MKAQGLLKQNQEKEVGGREDCEADELKLESIHSVCKVY